MRSRQTIERLTMIARKGSFQKAASRLYLSSSALVQQVKKIEEDLGFEIFSRDYSGVTLTEAGKLYLDEMQNLSRNYSELVSRCQKIAQTKKEEIVIGSMPNLKAVITSKICLAFHMRHPEVELRFREFFPSSFFQGLELGHFDVSVEYAATYIHSSENVCFYKLAQVHHCCSVLPTHHLAQKSMISFEDLRGERLMMYRRGITSCDDELRDYIVEHEPEIEIIDIDIYDSTLQARCAVEHAVLLTYLGYSDSFSSFITIPANFNIPIVLGVGCHRQCRPIVQEFVDLAREMYPESSSDECS